MTLDKPKSVICRKNIIHILCFVCILAIDYIITQPLSETVYKKKKMKSIDASKIT